MLQSARVRVRRAAPAARAAWRALSSDAADRAARDAAPQHPASRSAIRDAFAQRAADAVRYEYFAQRAELEAELEAAHMFRSLRRTCRQQAMGFMELMEEYDHAEFGATLANLELMADSERNLAEQHLPDAAAVAAAEQLPHVQEWFEDVADACQRASQRLDFTANVLDAQTFDPDAAADDDGDGDGDGDGDDAQPRAAAKR